MACLTRPAASCWSWLLAKGVRYDRQAATVRQVERHPKAAPRISSLPTPASTGSWDRCRPVAAKLSLTLTQRSGDIQSVFAGQLLTLIWWVRWQVVLLTHPHLASVLAGNKPYITWMELCLNALCTVCALSSLSEYAGKLDNQQGSMQLICQAILETYQTLAILT